MQRHSTLEQALKPTAPALRERFGGRLPEVDLGMAEVGALAAWAGAFRISQGFEVWRALGAWVAEHRPAFGPGVAERFHMASQITAAQVRASREGYPCCALQVLVHNRSSCAITHLRISRLKYMRLSGEPVAVSFTDSSLTLERPLHSQHSPT